MFQSTRRTASARSLSLLVSCYLIGFSGFGFCDSCASALRAGARPGAAAFGIRTDGQPRNEVGDPARVGRLVGDWPAGIDEDHAGDGGEMDVGMRTAGLSSSGADEPISTTRAKGAAINNHSHRNAPWPSSNASSPSLPGSPPRMFFRPMLVAHGQCGMRTESGLVHRFLFSLPPSLRASDIDRIPAVQ